MTRVRVDDNAKRPNAFLYRFFKNGSSIDMNVNGSVTPVSFRVTAPNSGSLRITRVNFIYTDVGMGNAEFGGLGANLSNGIQIKVFDSDDNEMLDFLDGETIKSNTEWALLAGVDMQLQDSAQTDAAPVRWTIERAGYPIVLFPGEYMEFLIQDDLTGLTTFYAMAQGVKL